MASLDKYRATISLSGNRIYLKPRAQKSLTTRGPLQKDRRYAQTPHLIESQALPTRGKPPGVTPPEPFSCSGVLVGRLPGAGAPASELSSKPLPLSAIVPAWRLHWSTCCGLAGLREEQFFTAPPHKQISKLGEDAIFNESGVVDKYWATISLSEK